MGIELVVGALVAGFAQGTTFTLAAGFAFSGFSFVAAATSFALGGLQSLLTPKPKSNLTTADIKNTGITQNVRQAITPRRTIYGEQRVGGAMTFIETTDDNKYIHIIVTLCDHEIEEVGEVWFGDVPIPPDYLNASGNVITGEYSGKVRLKFHLGTEDQLADTDLVAETSVDSNFRGQGVAYIYARLEFDRDVFPGQIPTITAFVRGKKVFDPRDDTTKYSPNAMLFVNDYLTSSVDSFVPGVGASQTSIDETAINSAINICDELVTTADITDSIVSADETTNIITLTGTNDRLQYQLGDKVEVSGADLPSGVTEGTNYYVIPYQRKGVPRIKLASSFTNCLIGSSINVTSDGLGTITKVAEPRYHGGGIIESSLTPKEALDSLLSASGGTATFIGGKWFCKAAAYTTPEFTFDESHIISRIVIRPKVSRRDRFNLVKGVYISPLNDGQASDYPTIKNDTYISQDNDRTLPIDYDLAFTQRPHTAQRLAKIKLERHRQEIFFEAEFKLHAMQVQPGDTVYINNTRMGWVNKIFEVVSWTLDNRAVNGKPLFFVKMALQETAAASYDWNNGEETTVDPAPNTNLPNYFVVGKPSSLSVESIAIETSSGDETYEFEISWTPPADISVVNGGHYNVQFKKSSDTIWRRSFRAEDIDNQITVKQVQPGISYDIRIQSVSNIGVRSDFVELLGFSVVLPPDIAPPGDHGVITGTVTETLDYGLITETEDDIIDYGGI